MTDDDAIPDPAPAHGYDFHEPLAEVADRLRRKFYELEDAIDEIKADLTQVVAYADAMRGVREAEALAVPPEHRAVLVARGVAMRHGFTFDRIKGRERTKSASLARCAVVVALRVQLAMSYPEIGRLLNRDHTTILSLYRRASALGITYEPVELEP